MKIHALRTGTVQIKRRMERGAGPGPLRLAGALFDRAYTPDLPIHAWLIEHEQGPILIDTGELADSPDMPIARFSVSREEEIDRQLARHGVAVGDLRMVVLTHLHGDHINGLSRLPGAPARASEQALRARGRALRRRGLSAAAITLGDGPFGAFPGSARLTSDGSVRAVPAPGHATGQIAILLVEADRQVMIGADTAYSQGQLLDLQADGVSMAPWRCRATMRLILAHAARQPTVYLPSHDPDSARRLAAREPIPAGPFSRPRTPMPAPARAAMSSPKTESA